MPRRLCRSFNIPISAAPSNTIITRSDSLRLSVPHKRWGQVSEGQRDGVPRRQQVRVKKCRETEKSQRRRIRSKLMHLSPTPKPKSEVYIPSKQQSHGPTPLVGRLRNSSPVYSRPSSVRNKGSPDDYCPSSPTPTLVVGPLVNLDARFGGVRWWR
ncbi:hypothetical protein LZ32DRAFT_409793 [Colletotrichum eremochloae]|nr:hypothetical protein LZ32DRAFT_409793 [Colletotrichum eremochloae]